MSRVLRSARETEVIAASLKRRYTGVTSTVAALLPAQARDVKIAALGVALPESWPQLAWGDFLRHAWQPPPGRRVRIWHARRNSEMLAGVFLKRVLRMPLKLVFTSAAQRHHSGWPRWLLRRMDHVIATSPEAASYLCVPSTVVPHGVDVELYRPAENREAEWAATGLPGRYGIAVFGRVRKQKGVDLFVEALCRLLPKYPDFTGIAVGAVRPEQVAFARRLAARVTQAALSGRILFLGERPAAEVPLWLRRVTIVVGPQRREGFGLVPLEGMASGAAVVATRVGAAHHLVVDGETGYLVPPEDLDALTDRIERLLRDPARAAAMGRRGRAHVVERFAIDREAEGIRRVYERCWGEAEPR